MKNSFLTNLLILSYTDAIIYGLTVEIKCTLTKVFDWLTIKAIATSILSKLSKFFLPVKTSLQTKFPVKIQIKCLTEINHQSI